MKLKAGGVRDPVVMSVKTMASHDKTHSIWSKGSDRQGYPIALDRAHGAPRYFNTWCSHLSPPNWPVCLQAPTGYPVAVARTGHWEPVG